MKPEEKIINLIRESLIERYGEEFIELTEREQTLLICDEINKYFDRFKNER